MQRFRAVHADDKGLLDIGGPAGAGDKKGVPVVFDQVEGRVQVGTQSKRPEDGEMNARQQ
jgi:hypothetical protein